MSVYRYALAPIAHSVRRSRRHIGLAAVIFFSGFVLGGISVALDAFGPRPAGSTGQFAIPDLELSNLFVNNLLVTLMLVGGGFVFGSLTTAVLFMNGLLGGTILSASTESIPLTRVLVLVVPHSILEIPGYLLAGAAGFKLPEMLLTYLFGWRDTLYERVYLVDFGVLTSISISLVLVSIFIEWFVTLSL